MCGLGYRLRPATPGWGVGVCVFVCVLPLYPATPGYGVQRWCVYLGWGFCCAPPLLAGVLGCLCACVRAPLVPRHSWLRCAVWVWVFGLEFRVLPPLLAGVCGVGVCVWARLSAAARHSWLGWRGVCVPVCVLPLYPATPGWGVRRGCVCLGSGFTCAPPLLAWVLVVCVLVSALPSYPATPGWGLRCVRVCLGSGFGCAPPLLAGVLAFVCAGVRAPLVPCHSYLGCALWVCVFGLGFLLRPATPALGVGVCVCLCACSARTPPLLAGVCGVGVCAWARVSAAPRHSWLRCWGVCVLVFALRLYPATPGWVVRRGCVCFGSGFGCAPPLLAGVTGFLCACVRAPLAAHHSWLGCAAWVCVFGLGSRLRPATPGWGGGVCVCWCACSPFTPPVLAGVCGVGVCVWAGVSAVPRHCWLGCWGLRVCVRAPSVPRHSWLGCVAWVCVFGFGFRLCPATPGLGVGVCVCSCARSACTPPLLPGVCGVVVGVSARVSAAPRQSWLGCAAWVCVSGLRLWLRPATPGSGGGVCVCACVLPPLVPRHSWLGLCGQGVGVWAQVSAAPRHSWLGCWGVRVCVPAPPVPRHSWLGCAAWVCVLGLAFRLRPATPGCGVRVCVCWCVCSACTPPLLAGLCGVGVCVSARLSAAPRHSWLGCWGLSVLVCGLRLSPATPGWVVRCGCVCLGSGFGCAPPLLAGVLGCVCACVSVPLVPRHSWLGCAARVCLLGLGCRLRPATPGWGVGLCVCWCSRSACTPPLLAGVCGVGVCAWARVSAAPRHCGLTTFTLVLRCTKRLTVQTTSAATPATT